MFSSTLIAASNEILGCESIPWNPMWSFANRNLCSADFTYFTHTDTYNREFARLCLYFDLEHDSCQAPVFFWPALSLHAGTLGLQMLIRNGMYRSTSRRTYSRHTDIPKSICKARCTVRGWSWSQFLHWTQLQMSSTCFHRFHLEI